MPRVGDEHVVGEGGEASANPVAVAAGFDHDAQPGPTSEPALQGLRAGGNLAFLEAFAGEVGEPHEATFIADVDAGNGRDFVVLLHGRATREINYEATRLLTECCKRAGVARLVYASTCSVYGLGEEVVDETSPLQPLSLYSESKAASERFLQRSADASFQPVILRIGTVFGWSHRPRFDLAVNLLTAQAHFDKHITIYNKQNQRPFVHVRDVATAFAAALRAPSGDVSAEVFNVGSETMNLQLARLAEIVRNHVPDVLVRYEQNGDARSYRASFEKIRRVLGVKCSTTLDSGISEILTALERGVVEDPLSPIYHNHRLAALPGPELNKQVAALRSVYGGPTVAVAAP